MGGGVDPTQKLSDVKAFTILLKCFLGPGLLALPFGLTHAGLIFGFSGIVIIGGLSVNGILLMAECSRLGRVHYGVTVTSYPGLGRVICGKRIESIISVLLVWTQLAVCCVYMNFVATNLMAVAPCDKRARLTMDPTGQHVKVLVEPACFGMHSMLSIQRTFIALLLPVFVVLSFVPNIKALAPLANVANVFMVTTIVLVLFFAVRAFFVVGIADTCVMWPHSTDMLFLFIGNALYSFEGVANIVPLTAAIRNQDHVELVLKRALICVIATQIIVAVMCYVAYQDITTGSITAVLAVNRRLAIPQDIVAGMNVLVMLAVVLSFPLQLFPAITLLEQWAGLSPRAQQSHDEDEEDCNYDDEVDFSSCNTEDKDKSRLLIDSSTSNGCSQAGVEVEKGRRGGAELEDEAHGLILDMHGGVAYEGGRLDEGNTDRDSSASKGDNTAREKGNVEKRAANDQKVSSRINKESEYVGSIHGYENNLSKHTHKRGTIHDAFDTATSQGDEANDRNHERAVSSRAQRGAIWFRKQQVMMQREEKMGLLGKGSEGDNHDETIGGGPVKTLDDDGNDGGSRSNASGSSYKDGACTGLSKEEPEPQSRSHERGSDFDAVDDIGSSKGVKDLSYEEEYISTKKAIKSEDLPICLSFRQLFFRTCIVLLIGAVAEAVPDLALVIDLFGSVFGSTLAIIVPNYLHLVALKLPSGDEEFKPYQRLARGGSIAAATIFATAAFSASMKEIFMPKEGL